ncbi:MAG: Gfo/Idh/MocA family oxidoreductase [Verrucomicrobiota bacterium]
MNSGSTSSAPKALVIGLGSIGKRHLGLLQKLGCDVAACTRHAMPDVRCFESLEEALQVHQPDKILIANATSDHYSTLRQLKNLGSTADLLVEKPLFSRPDETQPAEVQQRISVAYNLRFHPAVLALREALKDEETVSAQLYVGMHLSTWRPGRDYRQTYSAFKAQGGGVLRDLSHELDLGLWLFGPWRRLVAHGGHLSELEIETEDTVSILAESERCPKLSIEINYLDRAPRRTILVHTRCHTWEVDMLGCRLLCDGQVHQSWTIERNTTYLAQDRAWLMGERDILCSFPEGLAVLHMIQSIEQSITGQAWAGHPSFS